MRQIQNNTSSIAANINKYRIVFLFLAVGLWAVFMLYPFFYSLYLMNFSFKGINRTFDPLGNFTRLFNDRLLWRSVANTFVILLVQVPIMILMSIIFAVMLNNKKLRYSNFYRMSFFIPSVMGTVSFTVLFKIVLAQNGSLNQILLNFGLINEPVTWLISSFWAMVSIIFIMTWRWVGYGMIYYLSGLQAISEEIYEAALIDGASRIRTFFSITVPLLKPIILFNLITSTIGTLQLFELPFLLTEGGPDNSTITMSMVIFNKSFKGIPDMGYATMMSYLIVVLVVILSIIQLKVGGKNE